MLMKGDAMKSLSPWCRSPTRKMATCYWVLTVLAGVGMIVVVALCSAVPSSRRDTQQVIDRRGAQLLPAISAKDARALVARANDVLDLRSLQTLDPEVARQFVDFQGVVVLSGLPSISRDTAQELTHLSARSSLQLDGLSFLSADVAAQLAAFPGLYLSLNGLKQLAPDSAAALAGYGSKATVGSALHLNGIETLPEAVAERLGSCHALGLNLNGVVNLDAATAERLSQFKGRVLCLGGIDHATDETISALSRFSGDMLDLGGLKELSPRAAASLVQFGGKVLCLNSLAGASEDVLSLLAHFDGHLELPPKKAKRVGAIAEEDQKEQQDTGVQ